MILDSNGIASPFNPRGYPCPSQRAHHERWDGQGYPRGLKGEAIPLESRIIALADSLDAMTTTRPYKKGLDGQAALDEIQRCSGTQFDPKIVGVLLLAGLPELI